MGAHADAKTRVKKSIVIALIREVLDDPSHEKELLVATSGGLIRGRPVDIAAVVAERPGTIPKEMQDTAHMFRQVFGATLAEDEYCLMLHDVTLTLGGGAQQVPTIVVFFDQIAAVSVVARQTEGPAT